MNEEELEARDKVIEHLLEGVDTNAKMMANLNLEGQETAKVAISNAILMGLQLASLGLTEPEDVWEFAQGHRDYAMAAIDRAKAKDG